MNRWMVDHEVLLEMYVRICRGYRNRFEARCSDEHPGQIRCHMRWSVFGRKSERTMGFSG